MMTKKQAETYLHQLKATMENFELQRLVMKYNARELKANIKLIKENIEYVEKVLKKYGKSK